MLYFTAFCVEMYIIVSWQAVLFLLSLRCHICSKEGTRVTTRYHSPIASVTCLEMF